MDNKKGLIRPFTRSPIRQFIENIFYLNIEISVL